MVELIKKNIYKFFHSIIEKDKVWSTWEFLEKSQWWDKKSLQDFQSKKDNCLQRKKPISN